MKPPAFLAPCSAEHFLSEHADRQRLLIRRQEPHYFDSVLTLQDLDVLVTSVRAPASNINLAQGDTPLPQETYCVGTGYVDKDRLLARHREGATIILRAAEQWSAPLNQLRMEAEDFFGVECQINVYLTPAGQKSTPPHWDTHDLVVLQLAGSKVWRLYDGKRGLPLEDERFVIGTDHVSLDHEDVELHAGDTLYLPRGVIHEPVATSYSVHASIGVHVTRWYQVMSVALRLLAARNQSMLRQACPSRGPAAAPVSLADELKGLADPLLIEAAAALIRQQIEDRRARERRGKLSAIVAQTAAAGAER
jgi:ribosomal protein L16 Arg81 hydroxylase